MRACPPGAPLASALHCCKCFLSMPSYDNGVCIISANVKVLLEDLRERLPGLQLEGPPEDEAVHWWVRAWVAGRVGGPPRAWIGGWTGSYAGRRHARGRPVHP